MQGGLWPLTGAARMIGIQDQRHGLAITPAGQGGDVLGAPIDQRQEKMGEATPKATYVSCTATRPPKDSRRRMRSAEVTCLNPQAL
jgi:hypothetical protein